MQHSQLYTKINTLPNDLKAQVADFIDFLIAKRQKEIKKKKPKFGCARGMYKMASDFDAPLDDFKDYI